MRFSRYFVHTLFEVPKEAETPSHILLLRGSYIYPAAAGIYSLLPLGHRVAEKVKQIIREEMDGIDGLEVTMPVLNPAELWKATKRYYDIGPELFRIRDRRNREFVLAMTHEEIITDIAKKFLRSYRDLPVMLYQIQTKIRDEARPRAGLLRVREFQMKDAYSFHPDFEDLDRYYPRIYNAYLRVFARCGLQAVPIEADTGIMGGTGSHEFMLESPHGEDQFVVCTQCDYRANTEKAVGVKPALNDLPADPPPMERVTTPGVKTIAQLMDFFQTSEDHFLKTVAYEADGELVLAVVRGDFNVSSTKLANHLKAVHLDMASEEALEKEGLHGGFLSPVGLDGKKIRVVVDTSVNENTLYVAGGNDVDLHLKNVLAGRNFHISDPADIAEVRHGDGCAQCGSGTLEIRRGIELGHTFKLGTKYTAPDTMDVTFLDAEGQNRRLVMGCYGIGVERLMASVVESWHDEAGIVWPVTIAPFQVVITTLGKKAEVDATAEELYRELGERWDVLYDDRDESPGVKLKDADLLGIPVRVVVSQRGLKQGTFEVKVRQTGEVHFFRRQELCGAVERILGDLAPVLEGLPWMDENV
ncbi:prolyl-tRNA synthetase [Desulfacinum hydrothermale DSM 13146]|uniref:Proline--tRNA ligase n=1 Tax=Desulfacinum hydrothermale DSM 13146 TaxID=1121390 RepID=A0A1W1XE53_9BACT|nr:proline--tRNA ligase [Desulfacinum hydrothermale]SMC21918.1 prolyl-tRNA synthetase [Desulfacinum hydrothermale DSM 13146]